MSIENMLDEKLELVNKKMYSMLEGKNPAMNEMIQYVLQERGKQLRPKFLVASSLYCEADEEDMVESAAMIELLHIATLVHDDVIDGADTRRGKLSVHKKYGAKMAVYLGDYIIFRIMQYCVPNRKLFRQFDITREAMEKLCDGELGQNSDLYRFDVTLNEYLENIAGKTAALFELALKTGPVLSKAGAKVIKKFENIGHAYGMLFQIHDDLIDICSYDRELNKPAFQDFQNGIYTMPVIYAKETERANTELLKIKDELGRNNIMTEKQKSDFFQILVETDCFTKTCNKVKEYYDSAKEDISELGDNEITDYFMSKLDELYNNILDKCGKMKVLSAC